MADHDFRFLLPLPVEALNFVFHILDFGVVAAFVAAAVVGVAAAVVAVVVAVAWPWRHIRYSPELAFDKHCASYVDESNLDHAIEELQGELLLHSKVSLVN